MTFFSGSLAPSYPTQGTLLLSETSDISIQMNVRLNVPRAEIPHGSRQRGETLPRSSSFSPFLSKSGRKHQSFSDRMFFDHVIQPPQLTDGETEA